MIEPLRPEENPANQKLWAAIGRILAAAATLVALVLGLFQLTDRFSSVKLEAFAEIHDIGLHPSVANELKESIAIDYLKSFISARREQKKAEPEILTDIEKELDDPTMRDIRVTRAQLRVLRSSELRVVIDNRGSEVARDVRLVLPDAGTAEIRESFGDDGNPVEWRGHVLVGDVRPGARVQVKVWPKDRWWTSVPSLKPALTHSGGSGRFLDVYSFYGPIPAFWAKVVGLPIWAQWILGLAFVVLFAWTVRVLMRRGHIVLRPNFGDETNK